MQASILIGVAIITQRSSSYLRTAKRVSKAEPEGYWQVILIPVARVEGEAERLLAANTTSLEQKLASCLIRIAIKLCVPIHE